MVHDEIDLAPGTVRLKRGGGDGGHRGLRNIIPAIGSGFFRLRIGVGRPEHSEDVVDYVLRRASSDQQSLIDESIERSLGLVEDLLAGRAAEVMNVLNRKPGKARATDSADQEEAGQPPPSAAKD